ncbi:MAG: phosphoserine phosphatase [Methanocalculaceae archaeon]|nr:phosphoserine phosphatase [Methanocalculaceae archaeon]
MTEDLVEKRKLLLEESEEHRAKRNELNAQASQFARERNELNNATRQFVEEAQKNKELRDQCNNDVKTLKEQRNELNDKVSVLFEEINVLRGGADSGTTAIIREKKPSVKDILRQIESLEERQQTEVMTTEKERELVDKIKQLRAEVKEQIVEYEQNKEVRSRVIEARELRKQASILHADVTEQAELAQMHHDLMVECYRKADKSREGADAKHKQFVEAQETADAEHKAFLTGQKDLRDYEKILSGMRTKQKKAKTVKENKSARKEAESIFNAFKNGEKLTTEDLLKLQRSKLV